MKGFHFLGGGIQFSNCVHELDSFFNSYIFRQAIDYVNYSLNWNLHLNELLGRLHLNELLGRVLVILKHLREYPNTFLCQAMKLLC